jgi:hypothetical protein
MSSRHELSEVLSMLKPDPFCTKMMTSKYQGSSLSKMHTNRTYEQPFIEADSSRALLNYKIKVISKEK